MWHCLYPYYSLNKEPGALRAYIESIEGRLKYLKDQVSLSTKEQSVLSHYISLPMIFRCLYYSLYVLKWNMLLSPVLTFFSISLSKTFLQKKITIDDLTYVFTVSFLTGGYLLGTVIYEFSRSREYYYFYNQGISKVRLFVVTYAFHLIISTLILIIVHYAKLSGS